MANDPNRDLVPVKEGSCIDTCRSSIAYPVDFRERHAVCKLDRYELEDRHLRLLDEVQELKKYSNTQEEKIKRLSTKLMRVAKTPRSCISGGITGDNDRNKIQCLEIENAKLKDKITVLRNQILNHRVLRRSSSQTRRLQGSASSGPTTCRSDGGRLKMCASTNSINEQVDDLHIEKYINKIQELEAEREEMIARVSELESQLSMHLSGNQKEKVAENVEYIRVWRQMKQQQEKLNSMSELNDSLKTQIKDLKNLLDKTSKSKSEITAALSVEKKRMSELEEEIIKSKDSHMSLREKDEQIRDLMSEIKILQQHNSELISLSTRYNKVDNENIELKRKISEQQIDNNSLKSAFNNEKTNITALQAANNQLMEKLQELQKNMDTLTIQLKSFQNQQEKSDRISDELKFENKKLNKQTNTSPVKNKITDDSFDRQNKKNHNLVETAVQTEFSLAEESNSLSHKVTENLARNKEKSPIIGQSPVRARSNVPSTSDNHDHGAGNLSRDEMLKLLDNAQINTPLDSRNASQIRQIESFSPSSYGKTVHRQRQVVALENLLFGNT